MIDFILKKMFWGFLRHFLSDRQYAQIRYRIERGFFPNLENPARFTEKIQYLKLNDHSELRKKVADRLKMREYVKDTVGEEHLIPVLGVFDRLEKNDWDRLPSQFALKANHGCGFIKIVRDKKRENFEDIQQLTDQWRQSDYYKFSREWVYKNLPRKLIAEELLLNEEKQVPFDYKYFCFKGDVEMIQVDIGRFQDQRRNLYDKNFQLLDVELLYQQSREPVTKPPLWEKGIELAGRLSKDFNFIRVDLYLLEDQIYVGELTNFPGNGFIGFKPDEYDKYLGRKLEL